MIAAENFIENNQKRLKNYKKNRISNRLQYERESKEHEHATEDFESYQFEGNDLRQAVNNQTVIRGYEYGAKTIVTEICLSKFQHLSFGMILSTLNG